MLHNTINHTRLRYPVIKRTRKQWQLLTPVKSYVKKYIYTVSQKLCKIVLSELLQISTNFDNFWQKDGKEATIT